MGAGWRYEQSTETTWESPRHFAIGLYTCVDVVEMICGGGGGIPANVRGKTTWCSYGITWFRRDCKIEKTTESRQIDLQLNRADRLKRSLCFRGMYNLWPTMFWSDFDYVTMELVFSILHGVVSTIHEQGWTPWWMRNRRGPTPHFERKIITGRHLFGIL